MKVKIHREGTNILVILLLILGVINASAWMFIRPAAIPVVFSSISGVLYLLVLNFFRSPRRHFHGDSKDVVVSSVDGTVVALEEVYESECLHRRVIQLSVFMSVFNVHANWFPVNGKVLLVRHHAGRFMSAYLPKSSTENERSTVLLRAENGQEILVRQIAAAKHHASLLFDFRRATVVMPPVVLSPIFTNTSVPRGRKMSTREPNFIKPRCSSMPHSSPGSA